MSRRSRSSQRSRSSRSQRSRSSRSPRRSRSSRRHRRSRSSRRHRRSQRSRRSRNVQDTDAEDSSKGVSYYFQLASLVFKCGSSVVTIIFLWIAYNKIAGEPVFIGWPRSNISDEEIHMDRHIFKLPGEIILFHVNSCDNVNGDGTKYSPYSDCKIVDGKTLNGTDFSGQVYALHEHYEKLYKASDENAIWQLGIFIGCIAYCSLVVVDIFILVDEFVGVGDFCLDEIMTKLYDCFKILFRDHVDLSEGGYLSKVLEYKRKIWRFMLTWFVSPTIALLFLLKEHNGCLYREVDENIWNTLLYLNNTWFFGFIFMFLGVVYATCVSIFSLLANYCCNQSGDEVEESDDEESIGGEDVDLSYEAAQTFVTCYLFLGLTFLSILSAIYASLLKYWGMKSKTPVAIAMTTNLGVHVLDGFCNCIKNDIPTPTTSSNHYEYFE